MKPLRPVKSSKNSIRMSSAGVTLVELLVVIVIIGVLSTLSLFAIISFQRRERLNVLALEMAGWIEQVRNQAANEVRESDSLGGCTISFNANPSGSFGAIVASVNANLCERLPYSQLRIPYPADVSYSIKSNAASPSQEIRFTPRGMILSVPSLDSDFEYRFTLSDGRGPKRCLRISDITGTVDIGYASDSDLDSPCSSYSGL